MFNSFTNKLEVGIDEAGRGSLIGRVYAASVILPSNFNNEMEIKDSKKLSKKKRMELKKYIEEIAVDYSVQFCEIDEIDNMNILQATICAMHKCLDNMSIKPEFIIVDGNYFRSYKNIEYETVKNGDNKYRNIAAASILAKTYRDEYIEQLVSDYPEYEKYGWRSNMGYCTKKHRDALKLYGSCEFHRKSFKLL